MHRSSALAALAGASLLVVNPADAEFTGVAARYLYVDIDDFGPARIVRVYAAFDEPDDRLMLVSGSPAYPMNITAGNEPFYQDPDGGFAAPLQGCSGYLCFIRYDTYVDIGRVTSDTGFPLYLSPDFEIGETALATSNGAWARPPVEPIGLAGPDGHVFFGQFTVPADAPLLEGVANFAVRDGVDPTESRLIPSVTFSEAGAEPIPLTADVDGDQSIDVDDIVEVIANWGDCDACPGACDACFCYGDVDGNGEVNGLDLVCVITEFGSM